MTRATNKLVVRWPSAAVMIAVIAAATAIYIFVPEHRDQWLAAAAIVGPLVVAFMRRVLGVAAVAALALAIAIPSCTPAQKAAFEAAALSALELAAKAATRVLLSEAERALKFGDGGENP